MVDNIKRALMVAKTTHPLTQDVYHGTTQNIPEFRDRADDYALSYGLGVHVARDPKVASSEYFTNRNNTGEGGNMMPLKTLTDDKFYPVEQRLLPYLPPDTPKTSRTVRSDDRAVGEAIMKHALKRDPALMKRVLMEQRALPEKEAADAVKKLRSGEPWQHYDQTYNNIDELVEDHLLSPWNPEDRAWAVRSFRDDLIKKGYAGVKYINTSPNETVGADDPTCYIVFNKPTSEGYYPLRGRFAKFDPAEKASPDLMKSEGGEVERAHGGRTKEERRALMIARDQRNLLRRIANIYPGPAGGMDPSPGGGGYSGPGGGKYIGPSRYADGGHVAPTEAQKHAGNYKKQHLSYHGLPISIETPKGAKREGVDPNGKAWSVTMPADYGYIKRTEGADGDHVDVYLGPDRHSQMVFLINQHDHTTSKFDEHKVMLGYTSERAAVDAYEKGFSDGKGRQRIGSVEPMSLDAFKHWLKSGRTTKPAKAKHIVENRIARATGGSIPPFKLYSGAAKLIAQKGQAKATPQQYAALPGIKPDELKYAKFEALGNKAVPKEQVLEHLEGNTVPLQETVYTGKDDRSALARYHSPRQSIALPGGENYREVLLHTPIKELPASSELQAARERLKQANAAHDDALLDQLSDRPRLSDAEYERADREAALANRELERLTLAQHSANERENFQSSHWHDVPNVFAHIRMSDRRGPNGEKVLHVEEVQSDWGQQGREGGFHNPEETARRRKELFALPEMTPEQREEYNRITEDRAVPYGPYVDNTQKWTDLALKRVLHEAAHGGYDKIVVTPGDEQNKRYDLSNKVKNISYFPDIGYLHATTHDNEGIEHNDVKPADLAKHIGKEAADRILKQAPQRYEGRGNLGGEFYHELEGDDLKMGGSGMRGYYDNILPKRLQALAQQHDPQAKVQLGGYALKTPQNIEDLPEDGQADYYDRDPSGAQRQVPDARRDLHSLDVTPQMRDSIKQGGFNSFKRGGEVGDDPIKDWQWRPIEDVRNELQLDEIPSHVHKFGEFMDESARRAMNEGFTPRDLIKAYTITRASIQRRAQAVENIRKSGLILPPDLKGMIRPEGAFGHWLHTKHGQRYLDEAEAGRVDEEAIADAQKVMKPFGKTEKDLPDALRWAPKNLPGQEGRISELVARAYRGHDHPDDWRDATAGLKGIGPAKQGFYGANLGYGKLPTLDARQIVAHTGRPTKEAIPYLSVKGAPVAAVNRLSDRQTAMALKHDKSMSPFYQHLVHHTTWDKAAGEQTTHEDVVHPMRTAKDGGRQGYAKGGATSAHPVAAALRQALPREAFTEVPPEQVRAALEKTVSPFGRDPEHVKEALRIASTFKVPTTTTSPGGYYGVAQDRSPEEVAVKLAGLPGVEPKPVRKMSWEDLHKKGGSFINLGGDRSTFGRLTRIAGQKLAWPVDLHAGPNYMRELNPGLVWANAPAHATSLNKRVLQAAEKGPVYGIYAPMGPRSVDSAHHMFDAVMAQIPGRNIDKKAAAEFDAQIKQGLHMPPKKRALAAKILEKWPGVLNAKEASEFARTLSGEQRSGIIQHMDKKQWRDKGFPQIGVTRVAITDPDVFKASGNMLGHRVVQLDPDKIVEETKFKHGTYSAPTAGEYVGDVPLVQRHYAAPDVIEQRLLKPTTAGDIIHPYSSSPVGRSSARKIFEEQKNIQPLNQRQLDSVMLGLQRQKEYGLKTGGRAGYAHGGIGQLQQNLQGAFANLNQQVAAAPQHQQAAPAGGNYQAMTRQATQPSLSPDYQRMLAQALNGKTYNDLFPTASKPAPAAPTPAAAAQSEPSADAVSYYSNPYNVAEMMGGDGSYKRGGKVNIVERALAVTRRK